MGNNRILLALLTLGLALSCEKSDESPEPNDVIGIANIQDFWDMVQQPNFPMQDISAQTKEEIAMTLSFGNKGQLRGFGSKTFFEETSEAQRIMFIYLLLGYSWGEIFNSNCSCPEVNKLIDEPCIEIEEHRTIVQSNIPDVEPCVLPESCSKFKEHFICIR